MNFQPKDYSFIERAGQQVGQGIQRTASAVELAKKQKLSNEESDKVYQQQIQQAVEKVKQANPQMDDVSAHAFAVKYFQPRFQGEGAVDAVARWESVDKKFHSDLEQMRIQTTRGKIMGGVPQAPAGQPAAPAGSQAQAAPQKAYSDLPMQEKMADATKPQQAPIAPAGVQAGQGMYNRLFPSGTDSIAKANAQKPYLQPEATPSSTAMPAGTQAEEPLSAEKVQKTGMSAEKIRKTIDDAGFTGNKELEALYEWQANKETGNFPQGTTASVAMLETLRKQGGMTSEQEKAFGKLPTEYQEDTNARLREASTAANRARMYHEGLQGKKLGRDERLAIQAEIDSNDKNKVVLEAKLVDIKRRMMNKDLMGIYNQTQVNELSKELENVQKATTVFNNNNQILQGLMNQKGGAQPATTPPPVPQKKKFTVLNVE